MKILAIAEYVYSAPWRSEWWPRELARALAARGHDVTFACDGAEDLIGLAPCRPLARRPLRSWRQASPLLFAAWARRAERAGGQDVSLSFSHLVPADVWLPVGGGSLAAFRAMVAGMRPVSALLELAHQPWLPAAALAEGSLARTRKGGRRIAIGPAPRGAESLGHASRLDPSRDADAARARARELLGIAPRRPVLLVSAVEPAPEGLEPMLRGLAEARAQSREALAPIAIATGRLGYTMRRLAARAGCDDALRTVGATHDMAAMFAAADLAVAPCPADDASATGRFIADALRLGRPALADRAAAGVELLEPTRETAYTAPGAVVERRTAAAWRDAIRVATMEPWLRSASAAAALAGRGLAFSALVDRLEAVLEQESRGRAAPRPAALSG